VTPKKTILLVDDDEDFRAQLVRVFREAGYDIMEAADGPGALAAIDKMGEDIDLMIIDLVLPTDVNGLDIILTAARRGVRAKILAASAVLDDMYLTMAQELGADIAVRKPAEDQVATWWLQAVGNLLGQTAPQAQPAQELAVLADDEEGVRRLVKSILKRAGYQVLEAADGAAALALIEKIGGALNLLVTDYKMPHLNGVELVKAVREKYPEIPVVYMSGYASGVDGEMLHDPEHGSAFIAKPFHPKQFLETVSTVVARPAQ